MEMDKKTCCDCKCKNCKDDDINAKRGHSFKLAAAIILLSSFLCIVVALALIMKG
jgi:hypothetical protein